MEAAVVGAGITGITTAYYLAKAGYFVTIYDERRYPAMATSYANGGQLSASNAEVWNSWRNVYKGIKWLSKSDAPLKINPWPSIDKYSWFFKFIRAIPNADINTQRTCEMALEAHHLYKQIADEESIEFDKVERGILHIYTNETEYENAKRVNEVYAKAGLKRWPVTPDECLKIEPALVKPPTLLGGMYNDTDFTGDIHKFCVELLKVLQEKYAVKCVRRKIRNLRTELREHQGPIVVCAGVESKALSKTIGDNLPIYPVKGYSITIHNPGVAPWTSLLDDQAKIVTARLGKERLRVAGTAEFNGYNTDIIQSRIKPLTDWAVKMFPGISTEIITPWAGLRPMMPNMMPVVNRSTKSKRIYYNTGHGHLGWTLSAYTAQSIVQRIRGNNDKT